MLKFDGWKLCDLLRDRGMTTLELCDALQRQRGRKVSIPTLARWLAGVNAPDGAAMIEIAEILAVPLSALYAEWEPSHPISGKGCKEGENHEYFQCRTSQKLQ